MTNFPGYRARLGPETRAATPIAIAGRVIPRGAAVANVFTPEGGFAGQLISYVAGKNGTARTMRYFNPIGTATLSTQQLGELYE